MTFVGGRNKKRRGFTVSRLTKFAAHRFACEINRLFRFPCYLVHIYKHLIVWQGFIAELLSPQEEEKAAAISERLLNADHLKNEPVPSLQLSNQQTVPKPHTWHTHSRGSIRECMYE